jgi:hypothetical protein
MVSMEKVPNMKEEMGTITERWKLKEEVLAMFQKETEMKNGFAGLLNKHG